RRKGAAREGDEEVGWLKTLHRRRVDAPFRTHDQPRRKPGPKFASTPARNARTTQVDVTPRQRLMKFSVAAPEPAGFASKPRSQDRAVRKHVQKSDDTPARKNRKTT